MRKSQQPVSRRKETEMSDKQPCSVEVGIGFMNSVDEWYFYRLEVDRQHKDAT